MKNKKPSVDFVLTISNLRQKAYDAIGDLVCNKEKELNLMAWQGDGFEVWLDTLEQLRIFENLLKPIQLIYKFKYSIEKITEDLANPYTNIREKIPNS